ncbi:MAG TPA: hypothetical protein VHY35_13575 [Stellaceae bacterium]|nr:hypothetical protein [Stellaceae bacterium]
MKMVVAYRLAAFNRETDELIASTVIPRKFLAAVRKIAGIPASDDGAGDYPLNAAQVQLIAANLHVAVNPEAADYFLEPYRSHADAELPSLTVSER